MRADLNAAITKYYDFLTAYENILRDSITGISLAVSADKVSTVTWPPQAGCVWLLPRVRNNLLIIHAMNFLLATTMNWRDDTGVQAQPSLLQNIQLFIPLTKPVRQVWYASPDNALISPQSLAYSQTTGGITVTLPQLKYWSTVVVEFNENVLGINDKKEEKKTYLLEQNYPNPFNPSTTIRYTLPFDSRVTLKVYDILGKEVSTLQDEVSKAGTFTLDFNATSSTGTLPSGVYFYRLFARSLVGDMNYTSTKKMIFLK
jgi:hypothetical protein